MSNTATSNQRQVTFHPIVNCIPIRRIEDYTPKEISAIWYDEKEMGRITQRCFNLIKRMDAGQADKYCTRGLEGHSRLGSMAKKKNRASAVAAVLLEQSSPSSIISNQCWIEKKKVAKEQAIANAYQRITSSCKEWAQVMGKRDQEAVENILLLEECNRQGSCFTISKGNAESSNIITKYSPSSATGPINNTSLIRRSIMLHDSLHPPTSLAPLRSA